jgi:hypothetical protein
MVITFSLPCTLASLGAVQAERSRNPYLLIVYMILGFDIGLILNLIVVPLGLLILPFYTFCGYICILSRRQRSINNARLRFGR